MKARALVLGIVMSVLLLGVAGLLHVLAGGGAQGLGLTLASHLAAKYEGDVKVNSLPDQGTATRITLPAGAPDL